MYLYIITNGNLTSVSQEKANVLNLLFSIVFENEGTGELPVFPDRPFAEPLCSIDISTDKISEAIDKIKATKSKGPDNIHPKLVKVQKINVTATTVNLHQISERRKNPWCLGSWPHLSHTQKWAKNKSRKLSANKLNVITRKDIRKTYKRWNCILYDKK